MNDVVSIHQAKTNLSKLVAEVKDSGKSFVIGAYGQPQAMLVPLHCAKTVRKPGVLKGKFSIDDAAFTEPDEDILQMFYGDKTDKA